MATVRQQIVDATLALVADRGVSGTSVDDIAAAAGVAKGSIFYNFGTKSGLIESIIVTGVGELSAQLRAAVDGLEGEAAVRVLVRVALERVREKPDFARLVVTEIFRRDRDWQDAIALVRSELMGQFAAAARQAWPERDADLTAAALFGATLVAGLEWLVFQPERTLDEVLAAVYARVG